MDPEVPDERGGASRVVSGSGTGGLRILGVGFPEILGGGEEVVSGNGVNSFTELIVKVPNLLEDNLDFLDFHVPFHGGKGKDREGRREEWRRICLGEGI